jgi:SAM-dependent methyltransferase
MISDKRFRFGENWSNYVDHALDGERIDSAIDALKALIGLERLDGKRFLDIGSGSGLHSLAALRLGAQEVISFDYDPDSVSTTEKLREREGNPPNWTVFQGSILDPALVAHYQAEIVYSWGVLHHTGQMWQAVRSAAAMVHPGGLLVIALYNRAESPAFPRSSYFWLGVKRRYVSSSPLVQRLMILAYKVIFFPYRLASGKNPIKEIREYNLRGMSWHNDVIDWIGGYPYEFASVQEVTDFCEGELGLCAIKVIPSYSLGLNEFVFQAPTK